MNELMIRNEKSISTAVDTINLMNLQIKGMQEEVASLKAKILEEMQAENLKLVSFPDLGIEFNRIVPVKKTLSATDATNYLLEKEILEDFQVLDTKKVMAAFPEFVNESDGTEYVKIKEIK